MPDAGIPMPAASASMPMPIAMVSRKLSTPNICELVHLKKTKIKDDIPKHTL
jgi:hypothetical protein